MFLLHIFWLTWAGGVKLQLHPTIEHCLQSCSNRKPGQRTQTTMKPFLRPAHAESQASQHSGSTVEPEDSHPLSLTSGPAHHSSQPTTLPVVEPSQ